MPGGAAFPCPPTCPPSRAGPGRPARPRGDDVEPPTGRWTTVDTAPVSTPTTPGVVQHWPAGLPARWPCGRTARRAGGWPPRPLLPPVRLPPALRLPPLVGQLEVRLVRHMVRVSTPSPRRPIDEPSRSTAGPGCRHERPLLPGDVASGSAAAWVAGGGRSSPAAGPGRGRVERQQFHLCVLLLAASSMNFTFTSWISSSHPRARWSPHPLAHHEPDPCPLLPFT